jgi:hypothetical protein
MTSNYHLKKPKYVYGRLERDFICCNLSLGLATKARACKGAGQKGSPGVTFHALETIGECEGMNPHTPK